MSDDDIFGQEVNAVFLDSPKGCQPPKCDWCGKFVSRYAIIQPATEQWKLDPNDPELVCTKCLKKDKEQ